MLRSLLCAAIILLTSLGTFAQKWDESFREEFVPNELDWPTDENENRNCRIQDGSFFLDHTSDDLAAFVAREVPVPLFGEFALETQLEVVRSVGAAAGLIFNYSDHGNWESFNISTNGYYEYIKYVEGEYHSLIGWTETDRLLEGMNSLRVEVGTRKTTFSINGKKVAEYDLQEAAGSKVGFVVYNKQEIKVDHLSIYTRADDLVSKAQHNESTAISVTDNGYDNKIALVIGNSNYEETPLRNPENDAKAVSFQLKNLGFEVITLLNGTRKDMRNAILEFSNELLNKPGVGIFYYAGHGIQVDGVNFLVPIGAQIQKEYEIEDECIRADRVLRMLNSLENPMNIVILDACRNNPYASSFRSASRGLAMPQAAPKGSIIAFATAPGKTASDGEGVNGLYTQELIKSMQKPGLTIEEVFKDVRINVSQQSDGDQIPWENSSLMGDFYFLRN